MKKFIVCFAMLISSVASANPYDWKVTRAVDGDTVEIQVNWLPTELGDKLKIRIFGVDTPEKGFRAKCPAEAVKGDAATAFTKKFLASSKSTKVEIKEWDKFGGRVLGDIIVDGKSLRSELIKSGLAREYFGDAKKSWCD
ncbi:COG1525 Micrococcal nuclease (thermonuclease) homologs [uncultured Caudovirales phage]|uniref:COG1525 Micrococcal nuclease (Thermonuclease) homologs n=1 Tax=uncultured Caudovirales phage TaxID=2100421 RepID=A0A6J5KQU4_9CAUD|nr:COG1525 Micrococcal nuclease (thermonuclease) homologs [uncultured Caudovirales phage]